VYPDINRFFCRKSGESELLKRLEPRRNVECVCPVIPLLVNLTQVLVYDERRGFLHLHAASVDNCLGFEKVVGNDGHYVVRFAEVVVLVSGPVLVLRHDNCHRVDASVVSGQVAEHSLQHGVVFKRLAVVEPLETLHVLVDQSPVVAEVVGHKQVHAD